MDQQLILPEPPPDAAAQAFTELRQEISLMRRGMAKFIDEHPPVVIPDYTETLNDIGKHTRSLAISLKSMRETPVLQTTPEQIAKQIVAAGIESRSAEQAALKTATADNVSLSRELSAYLDRAKTADAQFKWLCGVFLAGFVIGGLVIGVLIDLACSDNDTHQPIAAKQTEPAKAKRW